MEEKSPQMRLAQPRGTVLTNMAVAALIIAALYFGREIFVPFAFAVLLSFVMAPFVIFQLPIVVASIAAPSSMSVSRDNPRQITVFPGGGLLARAKYPPSRAILTT